MALFDQSFGGARIVTSRLDTGRYQTILEHSDYNEGRAIVIANSDSHEEATEAHAEWYTMLVEGELPDEIYDENESRACAMLDARYGDEWRRHRRAEKPARGIELSDRPDIRVPLVFGLIALVLLALFILGLLARLGV